MDLDKFTSLMLLISLLGGDYFTTKWIFYHIFLAEICQDQ
jgi:hypothetical protein